VKHLGHDEVLEHIYEDPLTSILCTNATNQWTFTCSVDYRTICTWSFSLRFFSQTFCTLLISLCLWTNV